MKTVHKKSVGIFTILCLFFAAHLQAQTYYAIAYTNERADGDNGTQYRPILSYVFLVQFCKNQTVSLYDASRVTSEAKIAIESKFEEEYNYSLKRKGYWMGNKMFVTVEFFETSNDATSAMKKFIAKYKEKKDDDQGDIGMIEIRLNCIK